MAPRAESNKDQWTRQEEAFCRAIASGLTQGEAWLKSHPKSKAQRTSAQVCAAKLLRAKPWLRHRIEEIRQKVDDAMLETSVREAVQERVDQVVETMTCTIRTIDDLAARFERLADAAEADKEWTAAGAALLNIGRLRKWIGTDKPAEEGTSSLAARIREIRTAALAQAQQPMIEGTATVVSMADRKRNAG